ncbi:chemotaxis protein CheW [Undibacterium sp. SXout7W]|uniref:chemotaxis protein CheW n=1 Tax=Undibacterium sp. SXout7W TaxID=3413049 RepID=UPI003BF3D4EB
MFEPNHSSHNDTNNTNNSNHTDLPLEILAFTVGDEEYGIDIQKVQELRSYNSVTRIANAAEHMKGVVNLRGVIVPMIDMRIKLNLGTPTYNDFTVVIVLNLAGNTVGIVVDNVSDVVTLSLNQIKPAPSFDTSVNANYILGLGTIDERMLILVNVEEMISAAEINIDHRLAA